MVNLVERINKTPLNAEGYHVFSEPSIGELHVTPAGLEIIKTLPDKTEELLIGMEIRRKEIAEVRQRLMEERYNEVKRSSPKYLFSDTSLHPHAGWIPHKLLGSGTEGSAFQFQFPKQTLAIKYFNAIHNHSKDNGFGQFLGLLNHPKESKFYVPEPYFATNFFVAMEDMSRHIDYFAFVKKNPREEERLLDYLKALIETDPVAADIGDIFGTYAGRIGNHLPKGRSSIFIMEYSPRAKASENRYKLGTVDVTQRGLPKRN